MKLKRSIVLITGSNGRIGSAVADRSLQRCKRVRVRYRKRECRVTQPEAGIESAVDYWVAQLK